MRITIWALIVAGTLAPSLAGAQMYRWVDHNGLTHYSDRVPPQYAKAQREVVDDQGRIVDVMKREPTAGEIAATKEEQQQALAAQAVAARQAQYDRSLTDTYTDVKQLDSAYQDRLAIIDEKIKSVGETRAEIRTKLDALYERMKSERPEASLDKRIKQGEARLQRQNTVLANFHNNKNQIEQRYQADRLRYLALTSNN